MMFVYLQHINRISNIHPPPSRVFFANQSIIADDEEQETFYASLMCRFSQFSPRHGVEELWLVRFANSVRSI